MHDVERAVHGRQRAAHGDEVAVIQRIAHQSAGNTGQPQAGDGRAAYGLRTTQHHGPLEAVQMFEQQGFDGFAGTRTRLTQQPAGCAQLVQTDLTARQRTVWGANHDQRIAQPRCNGQVVAVTGAFDEPEIDLELRHGLGDGLGVAHTQTELRGRKLTAELRHDARQNGVAHGAARADAQRRCARAEQRFDAAGLIEDGHGAGQQQAAGVIEHQPFADPVEDALAELRFQFRQRRTDGGLRHRQGIARGGGTAAVRNLHQHFHLPQGQSHEFDLFVGLISSQA